MPPCSIYNIRHQPCILNANTNGFLLGFLAVLPPPGRGFHASTNTLSSPVSVNPVPCSLCSSLQNATLNKHKSWAVVFGPEEYGGLDLPELYTSEGIGQLHFLLGHLWLWDKPSKLILIDISYMQLLVVSTALFFNLPFKQYSHSTDGGACICLEILVHHKFSVKYWAGIFTGDSAWMRYGDYGLRCVLVAQT